MPHIKKIFTYPIKGFPPLSKNSLELHSPQGPRSDRCFAFKYQEIDQQFNFSSAPLKWANKWNFLNQYDWPALALLNLEFDEKKNFFKISAQNNIIFEGNIDIKNERDLFCLNIKQYLQKTLPADHAKTKTISNLIMVGLRSDQDVHFTDAPHFPLSFAFQESIHALGLESKSFLDPIRFRLNILLEGGIAWEELGLEGKNINLGSVPLEVGRAIARCRNIDVNPQNGRIDENLVELLKKTYNHSFLGVRANVLNNGTVHLGDHFILHK